MRNGLMESNRNVDCIQDHEWTVVVGKVGGGKTTKAIHYLKDVAIPKGRKIFVISYDSSYEKWACESKANGLNVNYIKSLNESQESIGSVIDGSVSSADIDIVVVEIGTFTLLNNDLNNRIERIVDLFKNQYSPTGGGSVFVIDEIEPGDGLDACSVRDRVSSRFSKEIRLLGRRSCQAIFVTRALDVDFDGGMGEFIPAMNVFKVSKYRDRQSHTTVVEKPGHEKTNIIDFKGKASMRDTNRNSEDVL